MALKTTLRVPTALNNVLLLKTCPKCHVRRLCLTSLKLQDRESNTNQMKNRPFYSTRNEIRYPKPLLPTISLPTTEDLQKRFTPNVSRDMMSVLLFPGQGSQFVGMGKALLPYPGVEEIYNEASDILGYDLLDICINGPKNKLDRTLYCQPAMLVTSLAAVKKLKAEYPQSLDHIAALAGFSVGEITALVMGGVLSFADAVQLIKLRAKAMQEASEAEAGGMLTVFLGADSKLRTALMASREFCRRKMDIPEPVCEVAINLSINVKVLAGHEPALEFIKKYGKEWEIKDTKSLPVSGAFHTNMMMDTDSFRRFKRFLNQVEFHPPTHAIWANCDSSLYHEDGFSTKKKILQNYMMSVKWEQIMHKILDRRQGDDHPNIYEVGPGKQLGWVIHKINKKAFGKYKNIQV